MVVNEAFGGARARARLQRCIIRASRVVTWRGATRGRISHLAANGICFLPLAPFPRAPSTRYFANGRPAAVFIIRPWRGRREARTHPFSSKFVKPPLGRPRMLIDGWREGISITIKSVYEPINVVSRPGSLVLIEARGSGNIKPGTIMIYAGGEAIFIPRWISLLNTVSRGWMLPVLFDRYFFFFFFHKIKRNFWKKGERENVWKKLSFSLFF